MAASSSGGGGGGGVAAAPSSVASKCYNAECKELRPDRPRKGWRLRAGDFADLCDRCGTESFVELQANLCVPWFSSAWIR
ncbi:hypothetical protein MLD38_036963 [Melastoma candidum]|uniref:Uncharacterized protein n=1 Tax=Melastoma candidum TaxID=119954 RepID=A0ACB9LLQ0_9MYRT|nr:hypothetical protein MLD38_036963 [Melastoma candidum]